MKQDVKSLESTAIELQAKVTQLEAKLELNVSLLFSLIQCFTVGKKILPLILYQNEQRQDLALKVIQLEAKNVQQEVKIGKLEAKVEQQDSLLTSLLREKNERTAAPDSVPISNNASAVAIPGLPSSCGDLKMIGHSLSGFYSVMGSSMMESVYCDFTKLPDDAGKFFVLSRIINHSVAIIYF
jgi:hypothetical protein